MSKNDFHCEIVAAATKEKALASLTSEIDKWWTTAADDASIVGSTATFRFGETYNTMRVLEISKHHLVRWKCIDQNHVDKKVSNPSEWVGTELIWELAPDNRGTSIKFTHQGLTPALECYDICNAGWSHFISVSLKSYLETGNGQPYVHQE